MSGDEPYRGAPGAFPYAFRASESRLFRSYAVLGGVLASLVAVVFLIALVVLVADTAGTGGGTFTFVRAFFVFVGFLVVAPLVAPVLLVARHHRRTGSNPRYDAALAAAGYLFILSLYLGLVISIPPDQQARPAGRLAPLVALFYDLPQLAGLVPPTLAAALMALAHRFLR